MILTKVSLAFISLLALVALGLLLFFQPQASYGSVPIYNEYTSTSTAATTIYGATVTSSRVLRNVPGSLGSVIITGANTGVFNLYDATTSDITKRAASMATSTILLASFPASVAAGVYTFDSTFSYGLYFDLISGNMATGTITYRP